jgi:hypothetical protein
LKLKYLFDSQEFSLRHAVRLPLRSMSATGTKPHCCGRPHGATEIVGSTDQDSRSKKAATNGRA